MSHAQNHAGDDTAPGDDAAGRGTITRSIQGYLLGLGLAAALTGVSFLLALTNLVWAPSIPVALCVLAIAQMGVHLVFFLNVSSAPDQTNNFLALAFGILIVGLVIFGSMWIMANLNDNMMPMDRLMQMQR